MRKSTMIASVALALALGGCASFDRMASYGNRLADAKVLVDGRGFSIWVHPAENDLLIQRELGAAMGQGFVEGLTFNSVNLMEAKPIWLAAAQQITGPLGCTVTDAYTLDNRTTWEAPYTCPPGVDLRAIVMSERPQLRTGAPVHLPDVATHN
jgi:hypothetical protein